MTTSGALGFVQGLQGGMEHSDKRRRNKAIDNLLDRDKHEKDLEFAARKNDYLEAEGSLEGFPEFENPAENDPMLVRGFNWLKGKFGFGSKGGDTTATAGLTESVRATQDESAIPAVGEGPPVPTYQSGMADGGMVKKAIPSYADGGRVRDDGVPALRDDLTDEERLHRSYGEYYVTEDEAAENRAARGRGEHRNRNPYHQRYGAGVDRQGIYNDNTGGGPGEAWGDIKRSAIDSHTGRAIANLGPNAEASVNLIKDAGGPEPTGRAVRGSMQDAGQGALNLAGGAASDVVEGLGLGKIAGFVKGFVGPSGTRANPQSDPNTPIVGAEGEEEKAKALEGTVDAGPADSDVADQAVDAAVEMTPGHPDNSSQAFDWAEVSASGITPEDIPPAHTTDWAKYRKSRARSAALRGESQEEVQMDITKMQMQGFTSNLQQAAFLLQQNDARGAALAARMAWQYFPNGSDVSFGIAEGANGPILVGMGKDEVTGEPVGRGEPQILNPESINAMVAQVGDPTAWNAWTKDWHEMAQADREYNEITKPTAEAELGLTDAKTDYYRAGAAESRATAAAGPQSSLRQSDYDRGYAFFNDSQELRALDDEAQAQYLADVMSRIYQSNPGTPMTSVLNFVMTEHRNGTLEEGLAEIGLR